MAKILLSISLILLAAAAVLGFQTKQQVAEKIAELNTTKNQLSTTQADLSKTKTTLKKTSDDLATSNKNLEDTKTQLAQTRTEVEETKTLLASAKTAQTEAEGKVAKLTADIEAMSRPPEPGSVPLDNPAMQALQAQLADAQAKVKEIEVQRDAFQQRTKIAEEKEASYMAQIRHYQEPMMTQSVSGRVLNVNNGWNFVVLDIGDKQGVKVNSPLLVLRGGQMVAKLKITSVEPRQSIADVVGGSMAKGQTVQPGDRVVFAGSRGTPNTPPPAAGGQDAGAPLPGGAAGQPQ